MKTLLMARNHLLGQIIVAQGMPNLSVTQWAILIIVLAGIVGIVFAVVRAIGVQIPSYIIHILWILLAVVIGILAIKFIASMM